MPIDCLHLQVKVRELVTASRSSSSSKRPVFWVIGRPRMCKQESKESIHLADQ